MKLQLAKDLSLPVDLVTQTIAVLAKRRAGKSYAMRRLVEQLFGAGQQVVLVDPKGDQWGVRSAADGKGPGLPIVILGGERADVALDASKGEVVAKLVVEERVSVLLDLSLFRKHEVATFMTGFLESLYRLKAREIYRTPLMLVIDEADAIGPQKPQRGEERMLGAAEDIVRRGGQRGIGCVLVTQRSAVLNKNLLTQAQVLVALRTIAPQDLAAMNAWIDVHGTEEQKRTLMESLPSLPVGDAWVWSPGWPTVDGIFKRVHVLPIETFDSGATPRPGEKRSEPKTVADIDLDAIKRQMSDAIEKAKAEDPKELRRRIAELEREVRSQKPAAAAPKAAPAAVELKPVEVPALESKQLARLEEACGQVLDAEAAARAASAELNQATTNLREAQTAVARTLEDARQLQAQAARLLAIPARPLQTSAKQAEHIPAYAGISRPRASPRPARPAAVPGSLTQGQHRILTALAQYPDGLTREQLTVLAGYKRSTRDLYVQELQRLGFADRSGDRVVATDDGVVALGSDFERLPTGAALREYWLARLPEGERRILEVLVEAYPKAVERDQLSEQAGYRRSTRDLYLQLLGRRQLVERVGPAEVRASEELFG